MPGPAESAPKRIKTCDPLGKSLDDILLILYDVLGKDGAEEIIKLVYDASGSIITGDWDGMALGHPADLDEKYSQVYNTFKPGIAGLEQVKKLMESSSEYIQDIKQKAQKKIDNKNGGIAERVANLTQQQYRILMMFAQGMLNKQIAYDLNVSEATIKAHATAIFRKLDVRNRTQAVIAIAQLDISEPDLDS